MNITSTQVQKLLTGSYTFSQLGFSMMITRLKGAYVKDSSQENLQNCVNEINAFLSKYASVITADHEVLSKL